MADIIESGVAISSSRILESTTCSEAQSSKS
jgi:hypothetical protein